MRRIMGYLFILAVLLVACQSQGDAGEMAVERVWGRVSPASAENSAFYMTITNNSGQDDALRAVRSDACGMAELHESVMQADGVMSMRPVAGGAIPIPPGSTVELKVGGLHVMCMHQTAGLTAGQRVPLTLVFEQAGEVTVEAEIREDAP